MADERIPPQRLVKLDVALQVPLLARHPREHHHYALDSLAPGDRIFPGKRSELSPAPALFEESSLVGQHVTGPRGDAENRRRWDEERRAAEREREREKDRERE